MASSALLSVLILGIVIPLKCDFSSAYALEGADSGANTASLLYQIIGDLYELQNENKLMREKIEMLEGKLELQETSAMGQAEKIEILEEKLESGLKSLESELDTSTEAEKAHTCSPPYSYNAELNLCWRLETEKRANWLKAGWQCGTEGGHLIILDTPAKVSYIQHALIMANVSTVKDFVYVGGEDMTKEGTFRWINGEPVQGIPWAGGKPNNMGNADCLTMRQSNSFLFHDWQCLKFSVSKKLIQLRGRLENIQIINIHIDTSQN